jgi:hypothetical protein
MWLPKNERKLLSYYYRQINKVDTGQKFEMGELIKALVKKEKSEPQKTNREIILQTYSKLDNVNSLLSQRELIKWGNLDPDSITAARMYDHSTSQQLFEDTKVNLFITLTVKGYDLGRKYSCWFTRSGLWFAEFKHHWFWIIVAFVGGIVAKVVIELIVKWLTVNSS